MVLPPILHSISHEINRLSREAQNSFCCIEFHDGDISCYLFLTCNYLLTYKHFVPFLLQLIMKLKGRPELKPT